MDPILKHGSGLKPGSGHKKRFESSSDKQEIETFASLSGKQEIEKVRVFER